MGWSWIKYEIEKIHIYVLRINIFPGDIRWFLLYAAEYNLQTFKSQCGLKIQRWAAIEGTLVQISSWSWSSKGYSMRTRDVYRYIQTESGYLFVSGWPQGTTKSPKVVMGQNNISTRLYLEIPSYMCWISTSSWSVMSLLNVGDQ